MGGITGRIVSLGPMGHYAYVGVRDVGGLKISDLVVDGVSLRTTYRSDVASFIQNSGGKVVELIDALRLKTDSQ